MRSPRVLRTHALAVCIAAVAVLPSCTKRADEPLSPAHSTAGGPSTVHERQILAAEFEPFESDPEDGRTAPSLAKPNYDRLIDASRIVLRAGKAILIIDYPLRRPARFEILPDAPDGGFSVRGVVHAIAEKYAQIYAEEKATATKPIENIPGMMNRAESDGKYGIWGHNLDDLVLEGVRLRTEGDALLVELDVGS